MKKHFVTAILYTGVTAILLGIAYPLAITAVARVVFPSQANGQLIVKDGQIAGSPLIGQPFAGAQYFHSRPSAAGTGYDASASSGSNLGPTSKQLVDRVSASVQSEQAAGDVPVDLVTASGSGLDPEISPAAALYQVARIARARNLSESTVRELVNKHTISRQFGLFGEPRVNVLELNMELNTISKP